MSALLHGLIEITRGSFPCGGNVQETEEEESVPVTLQLCQWKIPQKRKDSTQILMKTPFKKYDYSKPIKKRIRLLDTFDPRPMEFRGTASERLPLLLDSLRGQQLCVSLLFDPKCARSLTNEPTAVSDYQLPSVSELKKTIIEFKKALQVSDAQIREIERDTRDQRHSSLWYSVRRCRLTASQFGRVYSRKASTSPDKPVLELIQCRSLSTPAIRYGIETEPLAIMEYVKYQKAHGHDDLTVTPSGFYISFSHPFLGASPDGSVDDPLNIDKPFGFLEVKCPYSVRDLNPVDACSTSGFCCVCEPGTSLLRLKRNHSYFAQVQGQMAIGGRPWCDFVVYTNKGISIERIEFDRRHWEEELLPKLQSFYDNCLAPELVSPVHALGIPIRDLSESDNI